MQKIRTSFTTQLSLWVAGFVLVISGMVIVLLASFSENVIHDETVDTTMQALENTALRIDNTLRQREMTAKLEHQRLRINRSRVERLIEENNLLATLQKALPNAQIYVTRRDSSQFDNYITGGAGGYRRLMYDDKEIYIFSQPIGDHPYCLAAVCPAEDIALRPLHRHCPTSAAIASSGRLSTGYRQWCTRHADHGYTTHRRDRTPAEQPVDDATQADCLFGRDASEAGYAEPPAGRVTNGL